MSQDIRKYIHFLRTAARHDKRTASEMRAKILRRLKGEIDSLINARRSGWGFESCCRHAAQVSSAYLIADACGVISDRQFATIQKFLYGGTLSRVLEERARKASAA